MKPAVSSSKPWPKNDFTIGWTKSDDPDKIEQDLMALHPREVWTILSHTITFHGRDLCDARKPLVWAEMGYSVWDMKRMAPDPQKLQDKPSVPASAPDASLSRADIGEILSRASHERNVDVDLLASIVKAESGGNTRAVSRTGARGLMQLMPATAANLGVHDSFHPEQNVRGGSTYIDSLLVRYHDNLALALAAYNAGPAAVDKYHGIPPYRETRAYVARVIHEFNRRALARQAQTRTASSSPLQR